MHPETPTWSDFVAAFELFRDPILCGVAAGGVLGLLSVFIVLRRMVFVTATLTQAPTTTTTCRRVTIKKAGSYDRLELELEPE